MSQERTPTVVLEDRHADGGLSARLPVLREPLAPPEHIDTVAFNFMKILAQDLHTNRLCLPSLPEVVIRIRHALTEEHADNEHVRRIVGSDPVLASRVVRAANSVAVRGSRPVSDLQTALLRLGLKTVYGLAMSTALQQVLHAQVPDALRSPLKAEWERSVRVAVIAQALARKVGTVNADEAFLGGLFHNVGKLFILKKAADFAELLESEEALQLVMDAWHNVVGFAVITHWGLSSEIANSARDYSSYEADAPGAPSVTAVVYVADRFAGNAMIGNAEGPAEVPSCRSLAISRDLWRSVIDDAQQELGHLHRVLGI